MHPLEAYLGKRRETLSSLATRAGTTSASLSRIIRYRQTPSVALIRRLVEATYGEVSAADLVRPSLNDGAALAADRNTAPA